MVAPVTGPFYKERNIVSNGVVQFHHEIYGYRQRKPYNLQLDYYTDKSFVRGRKAVDNDPAHDNIAVMSDAPAVDWASYDHATNKAFAKLVDDLGEASIWAVNLAEHKQGLAMIAKRAVQLARVARHLKRGDVFSACKELGLSEVPKALKTRHGLAKKFSDLWLELHFGWVPLLQDIHAALETLSEPLKPKRIIGRGTYSHEYETRVGPFGYVDKFKYNTAAKIQCKVVCTNPNLHIAQQLGFLNPATVAWELIPFSFVVDWFVNVGQCLGSASAFAGVQVIEPCQTIIQKAEKSRVWYHGFNPVGTRVRVHRGGFLPAPVLRIAPWKAPSPVRAATAIALLIQAL
jgi:hypothetical protein